MQPETRVVTVRADDKEDLLRGIIDSVPTLIPGVPNSAWLPILLGQVRSAGIALSAMGFAWGKWISGEETTMIAYAAMMVVCFLWSAVQKIRARVREIRMAAVAAAESAKASAAATASVGQETPVVVAPISPTLGSPKIMSL